jgi:hypothetical protein
MDYALLHFAYAGRFSGGLLELRVGLDPDRVPAAPAAALVRADEGSRFIFALLCCPVRGFTSPAYSGGTEPTQPPMARSARAALHASEYVAGGLGGWLLPLLMALMGLLPFAGGFNIFREAPPEQIGVFHGPFHFHKMAPVPPHSSWRVKIGQG